MARMLNPFQFLLLAVSGWMNQRRQQVIKYLREENRVPREQLGEASRRPKMLPDDFSGSSAIDDQSSSAKRWVLLAATVQLGPALTTRAMREKSSRRKSWHPAWIRTRIHGLRESRE
ncbi:MAG: hypothetical protein ACJ74Z_10795 [Bryobacteraceae bacterium]